MNQRTFNCDNHLPVDLRLHLIQYLNLVAKILGKACADDSELVSWRKFVFTVYIPDAKYWLIMSANATCDGQDHACEDC